MNSRFYYSVKQKLHILGEFEENKEIDSLRDKNLRRTQIRDWIKKKPPLMQSLPEEKQKNTLILHPGPSLKYAELYTFLYSYVKDMIKEKTVVNHNLLISIACNEDLKVVTLTKSGQRSLIDRFMKMHRLSLRTITTTTGGTQEQMSDEELRSAESFRSEFREIVLAHQIPPECIFNMDQSGLYYEVLPKKTIDIIGSKQSAVATRGGTKKRVTIISLISCAGELAKQYVIFKGTGGGRIEADLQAFNDDNTCFGAQEKAWTDKVDLEDGLIWYGSQLLEEQMVLSYL